jgi:hypothetical protein
MTTAVEMEQGAHKDEMYDEQWQEAWREIGQRLQDVRLRLDEPFASVAARAEMKPTDLAAIERGEARPSGKDFEVLMRVLGMEQEELINGVSSSARTLVSEILRPESSKGLPDAAISGLASQAPGSGDGVLKNGNVRSAKRSQRGDVQSKRVSDGWGVAREPGQITYYLMHACLRGLFKRTDREKAEIIYSWTSPVDVDVKIFTSVDARTGLARPRGEDAIRIVVYDKRAKRKIVSWSTELKRVGSWQARLMEKAGAAIIRASYRPQCPTCRQDTMIIYGRPEAQFWGCSNYPKCGSTSDLEWEERSGMQRGPIAP